MVWGAGEVIGGQAEVLIGGALALVPAGEDGVAPGGVNPAGGCRPAKLGSRRGTPPSLAGDVGHVDPQPQEKVLVGFGIAPTQSRAVYHDVYDGVTVHHLVVRVVDEVGIHPQGLVILRGAPIDGGQAVCRPLVNLGLGGLPAEPRPWCISAGRRPPGLSRPEGWSQSARCRRTRRVPGNPGRWR